MRSAWWTPAGSTAENSCAPRSTARTPSTRQSASPPIALTVTGFGARAAIARPASSSTHTTEDAAAVDDRGVEQPRLGVEVVLHRRVEVEVVAGQVGEAADGEFDPVDASEAQRVARHLHHDGVDALLEHQRKQGLQIGRFRCGQRAGQILAGDPDADGADQPGDPVGGPQPRLDQVGGGGLARCAGHPDHPKVARRVAVDGGGQPAEHRPRVGTDEHGHRRIGAHVGQAVRIGEHGHRAARDGVSRVAPAVRCRAGQRGEQVARLRVLAAQGDTGDDGLPPVVCGMK